MPFFPGARALILTATFLTPIGAHALEIGSDPSVVAGVKPGMSQQQFHTVLSEQGYTMIPGSSATPGANLDIALEDGTVVSSAFGYGTADGGRIIYVETGEDGQGVPIANRVTGVYSFSASEADHAAMDAAFDAKYGSDVSCMDPTVGAVFQYDANMGSLADPDCSVLHPLMTAMPKDLISRSLSDDDWAFTATGVKVEQDGTVTLIESVHDNALVARTHGKALGMQIPEAPSTAEPTSIAEQKSVAATQVETAIATAPATIDGFIAPGKSGPLPSFLGIELGMSLLDVAPMLERGDFEFTGEKNPFMSGAGRAFKDPIYHDVSMDIAYMPYPQKVLRTNGVTGEPPIRFKALNAQRRNADNSLDMVQVAIVQDASYKGIDREAPIVRLHVSRSFPQDRALDRGDWVRKAIDLKFQGGCAWSQTPSNIILFDDSGKVTGRPSDEARGCMEWELVHDHRYRALRHETYTKPQDGSRSRIRKIEILIDDHKVIEEALLR
jgi:hypothetical protein